MDSTAKAIVVVDEVGCERYFSLSGCISSPLRTRLGVRNYERLAMLASIVDNAYVDVDFVVKKCLERCKKGTWKKENTEEALKCWNFERVIDAGLRQQREPTMITLEEFVSGTE